MVKSQIYILGAKIDDVFLNEAIDRTCHFLKSSIGQAFIVTPNPEICLYALTDDHFRRIILDRAFLSLPDGFGLKLAAWIFGEHLHYRVTGVDYTIEFMKRAADNGWRVFLLGGENSIASRCAEFFKEQYKGLEIVGVLGGEIFHPTGDHPKGGNFQFSIFNEFSNDQSLKSNQQSASPPSQGGDQGEVIESINQARPDILLVALGAPKQEKWIAENLPKLTTVRLAVGVGGTFDFIAGRVKRAPRVMREIGLEWLWRLFVEPWRARRIYNATIKFMLTVLKWRLRIWFVYRPNVVGLIMKGGKILLVERADEPGHWQLPQGGIEKGEYPRDAFFREMEEELGVDALSVTAHIPRFFRYKWPKANQLMQGYRGQSQDLFIAEFMGRDEDIHLDQDELMAYRWVSREDAVSVAHPVRKEQVTRALSFVSACVQMERHKLYVFMGKPGAGKSTLIARVFPDHTVVDVWSFIQKHETSGMFPEDIKLAAHQDMYAHLRNSPIAHNCVLELGTNFPEFNSRELFNLQSEYDVCVFLCDAPSDVCKERVLKRNPAYDKEALERRLNRDFPMEQIGQFEKFRIPYYRIDMRGSIDEIAAHVNHIIFH